MLLEEEHMVTSLTSPEITSAGDTALGARAMAGRGEAAPGEQQRPGLAPLQQLCWPHLHPQLPGLASTCHLQQGSRWAPGYSWVTTDI